MVPVGAGVDHPPAVDEVAPEIVAVIVGVAVAGELWARDDSNLLWNFAVDPEVLPNTPVKVATGVRYCRGDQCRAEGIAGVAYE
jgi:hypothetical protein